MLSGVDVAVFQGPPGDWQVAAGNIEWAAVKLTELSPAGPYVNPDAEADWAWLKANGKLRIGYLFGHSSVSAAETVALFETTLTALGFDGDDMVALDLEVTDGRTAAEVAQWGRDVLALLKRNLKREPILYTFLSFADAGNCDGMGSYPLWIADPSMPEAHPRVPYPWTGWALHQFVITGPIDRDVARYSSRAEMTAALGVPKPRPDPPVPPREDAAMQFVLPAGGRATFPVWVDAADVGAKPPPYDHVSLMVAGDPGAVVSVTFHLNSGKVGVHKVPMKTGQAVPVEPAAGWRNVGVVTVVRSDTDTAAVATAVLNRW